MSEFNGTNGKVFDYDPRLKRLRQYVDENYSRHIPLVKAAQISGVQMSSFCAFFRAAVGMNFTDWLGQVRISKAIELMKTNGLSITRIAHDVGFVEMITFEREFKKNTQRTPREFKKSLRSQFDGTSRGRVKEVLRKLTPREEQVVRMRFGIGDGKAHTLKEVGQKFSVTGEQIRQIEAKALRKLRGALKQYEGNFPATHG